MNTVKQNKEEIYNDILEDIAHEVLIFGEQLSLKIYNLINRDYEAQERYPFEEIEKIVIKKLNKTNEEDLNKLKELYTIMNNIAYSYFKKCDEYFNNEEKSEIK
ncbi:hypothetical protein [Pedobacter sp. Leaf170]|uniref:hypothetical protein n=1 Tax=Pedobacter sp. Leaf170 TaxID=2876558 RepID=UPI001E61BE0B|nr:hypothetical protein [Pedobacter sp. Leaf170]